MRGATVSVLFVTALALAACDDRPKQWDAFVYPDAENLAAHEEIRGFTSFDHCQTAAINHLRQHHDADAGDYECGYRCGPAPGGLGGNLCEETRK
jgi:hypothetical protein